MPDNEPGIAQDEESPLEASYQEAGLLIVCDEEERYRLYRQYLTWRKVHSPGKSVYVRVAKRGGARPAIAVCSDKSLALRLNPQVKLLTWAEFSGDVERKPLHLSF